MNTPMTGRRTEIVGAFLRSFSIRFVVVCFSSFPESKEDDIRKRVDIAMEAEDELELAAAAEEFEQLGTERAITEKARVDHELNVLKMKKGTSSV